MCSILCISTQGASVSNAFNAIYVKAVNTFSTQYIYTHVMVCMSMQLNYKVDSCTKSSNYMKIRLKALNYFELQQTLK